MILASSISLALVALAVAPADSPPVQRPAELSAEPAAPEEPGPAPADEATATEAPAPEAEPAEAPASGEPAVETEAAPDEVVDEPAETETADGEVLHAASERPGPPYYAESDLAELRERYGVEPSSPPPPSGVRWRCLIADPSCRHTFEIQATGAYALRARQGAVDNDSVDRWNSARAQYDLWASLPALTESVGKSRYTRMSLGPKGGVIFSDTGDLWGNLGIAMRYWLGRGRWAPSIEVTSALAFKLGTRVGPDGTVTDFRMKRGPVGFQADVGFGLGGFGSIVIGGQYDSPLAREDIPEEFREVSSGMFYVGFRGNILWGGPIAAAVGAHASTRAVQRP